MKHLFSSNQSVDSSLFNKNSEYTNSIAGNPHNVNRESVDSSERIKVISQQNYPANRACLWCKQVVGFYTVLRVNPKPHYADIKCNSCNKGNGYLIEVDFKRQILLNKREQSLKAATTRLNGGAA